MAEMLDAIIAEGSAFSEYDENTNAAFRRIVALAQVERDVGTFITALKDVDSGTSDESYRRLHEHLCPMIYEMRRSRG